jgi:hypothetical protein
MDETILTWNITNWITVVIMAALGFLLLALIAQVFHNMRGTGSTGIAAAAPVTPVAGS